MIFVTTPTRTWLMEHLANCKEELLVACPFIGDSFVSASNAISSKVRKKLITRTDLAVFAAKSSDLEAVIGFAALGGEVRSLPGLHAKVYVLDRKLALVTSANATFSGLNRNWECGVVIDSAADVLNLTNIIEGGFGSSAVPQRWTASDLQALRPAVQSLRDSLPKATSAAISQGIKDPEISLPPPSWNKILDGLPGWTRLTLTCVLAQETDHFDIKAIYASGLPLIEQQFPKNTAPREKLRQQLQRLRDLGMIEFLGDGQYRRLVRFE